MRGARAWLGLDATGGGAAFLLGKRRPRTYRNMMFNSAFCWLFGVNPAPHSMVPQSLPRPHAEMIRDLLLPGVRGALGRASQYYLRKDWNKVERETMEWFDAWVPQHLDDYRTAFHPALMKFLELQILDPDCYPPLVLEAA